MCKNPRCDGTRLGHDLFLMERTNPEIRAARDRLDLAVDRILHPDDYVRPENLQVDGPSDAG